ncbi:MAG: glutamate ligase domain-containing protein, partial [Marinicella sp.]
TIPHNGQIVVNGDDNNLSDVLAMGCWTPVISFGSDDQSDYWVVTDANNARQFSIHDQTGQLAQITWNITGKHNQLNALAAILAAVSAGVAIEQAADSISRFQNVKRRMELIGTINEITIYDDFAHHPTAIETTLAGLKAVSHGRTIAVLEPRSNSMRSGVHAQALPAALSGCDQAYVMIYPEMDWDEDIKQKLAETYTVLTSVDDLLTSLQQELKSGDEVVFMSNGSFDNAPRRLLGLISEK